MCWPDLMFVAENTDNKKIVGYVIGKIDEKDDSELKERKGHITSISVLKSYRRMGIANRLMIATHRAMKSVFDLKFVTLHVRETNEGALGLYKDSLKYEVLKITPKYYSDNEDAYFMKKVLTDEFPEVDF